MNVSKSEEKPQGGGLSGAIAWLWRLLASIKLAVILILVLTALSLIGTFVASARFFHTWWYLAPGALLMLNILVCSINRWPNLRSLIRGAKVQQPDSFFHQAKDPAHKVDAPVPPDQASARVERVLRQQGYRVRSETMEDRIYLAADKNRYFRLATYISHLSLILFVLAYILGSSLGFKDPSFVVAEGEIREVGHNTGLSLKLNSFVDEYYADNTPQDFRSQVTVYKNGQEVEQALIRVNHPLYYGGIRFYQSFFGPAIQLQVKQDGESVFQGNLALDSVLTSQGYQRYVGILQGDEGVAARFISSAVNANDPMIPKGQLAVDIRQNGQQVSMKILEKAVPLTIGSLEFTYLEDARYSGFQVSRDPGNTLIWIAASLFILGMVLVLYFTHRQLWIMVQPSPSGQSRLSLRLINPRGFSNTAEMTRISRILNQELIKKNPSSRQED